MNKIKVYWIRHKDHTNILSEGYVGVTSELDTRIKAHKSSRNKRLNSALKKYSSDIHIDVMYEYETIVDALDKEFELRPEKFIGWNLAPGGGMPPSIKDYPEAIERIRKSVLDLKMTPYDKEKTHSKETIEKANNTKKSKGYAWYHNPETLEYKMFAANEEQIPDGWFPGRVPKKKKLIRGKDYECNVKSWFIIDPDGNEYTVTNLKNWCKEKDLPYFASHRKNTWRGWYFRKMEGDR